MLCIPIHIGKHTSAGAMKVIPFSREYAWPDASNIVNFDPDIPADLSRLHMLYQAVYDAEELEQLADWSFTAPKQVASN
jgi:hypothetical protein